MKQRGRPAQASGDCPAGAAMQTPSRDPSSRQTSARRSQTRTGSVGVPAGLCAADEESGELHPPAAATAMPMAVAMARKSRAIAPSSSTRPDLSSLPARAG